VGLYVYGNTEIQYDLFVNDYARIDALRVGVTSTDPGDGNLYVEGDATIIDDLSVGDDLTVGDKLQLGVSGAGELLANNGCFGQNYGADAWGGDGVGIRKDTTTGVVFYAENHAATDGYGGAFRAGNGGTYILWLRSADGTDRFKFYANGATSPSDISDERLKINISDFDGSALDNVKWLSNNLKTFNFKCDENDDTLLMPQNTYTGFVAQTLLTSEEDSIKRLVHTANETMESGDRYYLDYKGITAQLARAVQELSDKNDELSAKMEALEAQISGSN
jgi:cell division protein FtsB